MQELIRQCQSLGARAGRSSLSSLKPSLRSPSLASLPGTADTLHQHREEDTLRQHIYTNDAGRLVGNDDGVTAVEAERLTTTAATNIQKRRHTTTASWRFKRFSSGSGVLRWRHSRLRCRRRFSHPDCGDADAEGGGGDSASNAAVNTGGSFDEGNLVTRTVKEQSLSKIEPAAPREMQGSMRRSWKTKTRAETKILLNPFNSDGGHRRLSRVQFEEAQLRTDGRSSFSETVTLPNDQRPIDEVITPNGHLCPSVQDKVLLNSANSGCPSAVKDDRKGSQFAVTTPADRSPVFQQQHQTHFLPKTARLSNYFSGEQL